MNNNQKIYYIIKTMNQNNDNKQLVFDCMSRLLEFKDTLVLRYFENLINKNIHNHFKACVYSENDKNYIEIEHRINSQANFYLINKISDIFDVISQYSICYCNDCNIEE